MCLHQELQRWFESISGKVWLIFRSIYNFSSLPKALHGKQAKYPNPCSDCRYFHLHGISASFPGDPLQNRLSHGSLLGKIDLSRELLEKGIGAGWSCLWDVLSLFAVCAAVPAGISPHLPEQIPEHRVGSAAPGEQTHHQTAHAEPQESQISQPQVLIPPHLSHFSLLQV